MHLIDAGGRALLPVHAAHAGGVAAHAARALRAAAAYPRAQPADGAVGRAVAQAIALWNEQLFFEVHEVLEAVWKTVDGDARQGLQGLIQIAVAYYHLAHGNLRGARSLLTEGRRRLASVPTETLAGVDAARLLDATAVWEAGLARHAPPDAAPPRLAAPRR